MYKAWKIFLNICVYKQLSSIGFVGEAHSCDVGSSEQQEFCRLQSPSPQITPLPSCPDSNSFFAPEAWTTRFGHTLSSMPYFHVVFTVKTRDALVEQMLTWLIELTMCKIKKMWKLQKICKIGKISKMRKKCIRWKMCKNVKSVWNVWNV